MPAQSKVISEKGVLSNQSDFEGWFWIVKRLANANEIWKYINLDDSERINLEEPAAEPIASSAAAATVWKENKKVYRSAKEGMAKLEKHITETLDAKLHGVRLQGLLAGAPSVRQERLCYGYGVRMSWPLSAWLASSTPHQHHRWSQQQQHKNTHHHHNNHNFVSYSLRTLQSDTRPSYSLRYCG
jgi:hypothetical protein